MFELYAIAAAVITIGILASRSDSEESDDWTCSDKFDSNMPKEVRDQAVAVMRNGTNGPAMLKFAEALRKGGFSEAADCVEARANELLGGKFAYADGVVETPRNFDTTDPVAFYAAFKPPFMPMAPSSIPAAPPAGKGVAED